MYTHGFLNPCNTLTYPPYIPIPTWWVWGLVGMGMGMTTDTPGYTHADAYPYPEETCTCGHGYGYSCGLRKMDPHPYLEDTQIHGCRYGYGCGLRKVDPGYDPPWVIPAGISLDDMDKLGRKTAIPGDHHKCQGWCQMGGTMSSACCDLK